MSQKVIEIKNLSFSYPDEREKAVKNVNLAVESGEWVAIMGASGSGKSTLCLTLNGIIPHSIRGELSGKVIIAGMDSRNHSIPELASKVGMVFQDPEAQLFSESVEHEVAFGPENLGLSRTEIEKRVNEALRFVGLLPMRDQPPFNLSYGQKQKLAIASALAMQPEVLVLDEPTSNLDGATSKNLYALIEQLHKDGLTVILVDHKSDEVALYADRIMVMLDGRVIGNGSPKEILSDEALTSRAHIKQPTVTRAWLRLASDGLFEHSDVPITLDRSYVKFREMFENGIDR